MHAEYITNINRPLISEEYVFLLLARRNLKVEEK
jgi:hypothetical protein